MKKNLLLVSLVLLALCAANLAAQSKLAPSATAPIIDGTMADKEYSYVSAGKGITFGLSLSQDGKTLYAALSAPTAGWVSIGLGSLRMNKSIMVIGYDDGASKITEVYGIGDRHAPANQKSVIEGMAKKNGNLTTLEFSVPAATFIKGDKLDVILAYSNRADFTSMHRWKTAFSVPVGK